MKTLLLHIIFFMFAFSGTASAQFLNIQLDVEPEVDTMIEQSLNFGQVVSNTGEVNIGLGDTNMGIFRVSALRSQKLLITVEHSNELRSVSNSNNATIPFDIEAAYTNFGVNDYRQSTPFTSVIEEVLIEGPPINPTATWSSAYVYIYGSIDIGNIPSDIYTGEVQITIVYE